MVDRNYGNDSTQPAFARTSSDLTLGSRDVTHRSSVNIVQNQFMSGDMIDGRYQVIGVIGRGGFGCVYKVSQVLLRKDFALKTLNPVSMSENTVLRLRKEAQTASRLEHPNLMHAHDFGMIDGVQPFLVMDFVEGPTLAEYLKEHGRLTMDAALDIFIPIAQAVAYAHRQGVVHRDLKPSNVILSPDRSDDSAVIPKIVDFGIAKIRESDESRAMSLTATGDVFGTPLYMSPEQCAGTGVDSRSDIYSMGCMLFEALTGAPPFNGRNALEIMMQHGAGKLPSLKEASLGESFPVELERILASMLAKTPEERYSNSQTIADDLFWLKHGELDRISSPGANGAVVIKKDPHKFSVRSKILVALASTIFGATLGYGLALVTRPAQKATEASRLTEISTTSTWSGDIDAAYLSKKATGGGRIFKFPVAKSFEEKNGLEGGWGTFYWWTSASKIASKKIPLNGQAVDIQSDVNRLILKTGYCMGQFPNTFVRYRHDELFGIVIDSNLCEFNQNTIATVAESLLQQHDLKVLSMRTLTFSPKSLKSIGYISDLQWLDLKDIWLEHSSKEQIHAPKIAGSEIAEFPNLPNLKVLCLDGITDVAPVLNHLNPANLRGLSLADDGVTDENVQLIKRFYELEVLNLRGESIDGAKLVSMISNLKKLKKLAIDLSVLEKLKPEDLKSLNSKGLTIMVAREKKKAIDPELLAALKGCEVISEYGKYQADRFIWPDQVWLDSLQTNPSVYGI